MSALAEALLAAQRQAIGAISKAYASNAEYEHEWVIQELDRIGCADAVDQARLLASLDILRALGGEAPKPTGQTAPRMPEQPTDAQRKYIAKLCKEKNVPMPDVVVSKEQASEIIDALNAGTYNADAYTVPF